MSEMEVGGAEKGVSSKVPFLSFSSPNDQHPPFSFNPMSSPTAAQMKVSPYIARPSFKTSRLTSFCFLQADLDALKGWFPPSLPSSALTSLSPAARVRAQAQSSSSHHFIFQMTALKPPALSLLLPNPSPKAKAKAKAKLFPPPPPPPPLRQPNPQQPTTAMRR